MNDRVRKYLYQAARYFFGDFNGVQVFLYPGLLFYLIDRESLLQVITRLFLINVHYFPISIFFMLMIYVGFIILKKYTMYFTDNVRRSNTDRELFKAFIIDLHEKLLVVVVIFMLAYVFAAFMKYFYGFRVPMKMIFPMATRVICIFLIVYYYLAHVWTEPIRLCGHNLKYSRLRLMVFIRRNPFSFIRFSIVLTLMIMISSKLYYGIVQYVLHPILTDLSGGRESAFTFILIPLEGSSALVYNVLVISAAFIISNLFFAPLVYGVNLFAHQYHPLNMRYQPHA
ncbi:MAG: hypothetical protein Q8M98_01130 [Candidatus Cloacimonadaceae bacterium]|nr:hypothetical protein [Candidatus Cloacimonadaceae bacterium]MDP3113353.1 hypothetical protein [Candidatus Cloacimonadaceae bacterium]